MFLKLKKRNSGSAAIEFIIVILPCLILMFLFLNVLLILGNLMLSQANANRAIQQIAASGCLPGDLKEQIQKQNTYLGIEEVKVQAYSLNNATKDYPEKAVKTSLLDCTNRSPSLSYVIINISYKQDVVLIPGVNSLNLDSEAVSVYSGYSR
jgi:hypothetical protein